MMVLELWFTCQYSISQLEDLSCGELVNHAYLRCFKNESSTILSNVQSYDDLFHGVTYSILAVAVSSVPSYS